MANIKRAVIMAACGMSVALANAWHSWSPQEQEALAKRLVDEIGLHGISHAVRTLHHTPAGTAGLQEFIDRYPLLKEVETAGLAVTKLEAEIQGNVKEAEAVLRVSARDGRVVFVNTNPGETEKLKTETVLLKRDLRAARERLDETKNRAINSVNQGMVSLATTRREGHEESEQKRKELLRAEAEKLIGLKEVSD